MANNLYPKLDMNTNDQLGHLLTVFLARACYDTTGSYKDPRIPRRWRKCNLSLSDGLHSRSKTVQSLCKRMKLNLFSTDVCTKTITNIGWIPDISLPHRELLHCLPMYWSGISGCILHQWQSLDAYCSAIDKDQANPALHERNIELSQVLHSLLQSTKNNAEHVS